jgi:hypothetical protein
MEIPAVRGSLLQLQRKLDMEHKLNSIQLLHRVVEKLSLLQATVGALQKIG